MARMLGKTPRRTPPRMPPLGGCQPPLRNGQFECSRAPKPVWSWGAVVYIQLHIFFLYLLSLILPKPMIPYYQLIDGT